MPDALDILARTPQHVIVGDVDSGALLTDPDLAPRGFADRTWRCRAEARLHVRLDG